MQINNWPQTIRENSGYEERILYWKIPIDVTHEVSHGAQSDVRNREG